MLLTHSDAIVVISRLRQMGSIFVGIDDLGSTRSDFFVRFSYAGCVPTISVLTSSRAGMSPKIAELERGFQREVGL